MNGNRYLVRQSISMSLKLQLKRFRRSFRRFLVASRQGSLMNVPIIFANSFPKSGTHLLVQVLQGFTKLGPVVESGMPAVVTFDGPTGQQRPLDHIIKDLQYLKSGDIAYGHLHALPEVTAELVRQGVAAYFIFRDPRDVVVSHVHYVTEMETQHVHHQYYRYHLTNFDERLMASILGRPELSIPFPDIRARFEPYLGWLDHSDVLSLRFEDFMANRRQTLKTILDHAVQRGFPMMLETSTAIAILESAIKPEDSPTFRRGHVSGWKQSFNPAHKTIFKEVAGDLLIRLGYEQSNDW